jgi:hypothetical protein
VDYNEIWKSKEVKNVSLRIVKPNDDGTILVTFDMNAMTPRSTHNYQQWYIEKYYENSGSTQQWTLDKSLMKL